MQSPNSAFNTTFTRGYEKLASAARSFSFDFRDKVVLDIGSSTGGFTEYVLKHGAKKVIAIEKGTNQMKKPLRFDQRIELHEKTDIAMVSSKDASGGVELRQAPDVVMADVSFTSLRPILLHVRDEIAGSKTDLLMMLKPQFEAEPKQLINGVVKNEKMRREIIKQFEFWLKTHGFVIKDKHDNALSGKNGNIERFYWLKISTAYA